MLPQYAWSISFAMYLGVWALAIAVAFSLDKDHTNG